jgi:hypothetical protein
LEGGRRGRGRKRGRRGRRGRRRERRGGGLYEGKEREERRGMMMMIF